MVGHKPVALRPRDVQRPLQMLERIAALELLQTYNGLRTQPELLSSWLEARVVVAIFKGKGQDTDPTNHRPISLFKVAYFAF